MSFSPGPVFMDMKDAERLANFVAESESQTLCTEHTSSASALSTQLLRVAHWTGAAVRGRLSSHGGVGQRFTGLPGLAELR